ncbi:hypothetical protein OEZ85_010999 [Tetradesmus obliquus]|uniref:Eukaryotic translation initiation factor 4C n=1 Tax=Tetradesmus obliquus TaxID=3088 RepID=A0ABY8TTM9_TETOB|nr:hypothetical protein OEZ85_010999 [Tetradesmus obliquus]
MARMYMMVICNGSWAVLVRTLVCYVAGVNRARKPCKRDARELATEEPGTSLYARVTDMLGNGRMRVVCSDGSGRLARIRGNMRRRDYIHAGDMVLVTLRDFEQGKVDVVFKYSAAEAAQLQKYDASFARLATAAAASATAGGGTADDGDAGDCIVFAEEGGELDLCLI